MKVWEGKQGVGFLLQGGLLRSQLDQLYNGRTKLSSTFFWPVTYPTDSEESRITQMGCVMLHGGVVHGQTHCEMYCIKICKRLLTKPQTLSIKLVDTEIFQMKPELS